MGNQLYKDKYRTDSIRLQHWDYRNNAVYFITICTKDRYHFFGEIKHSKMITTPIGAIADVLWFELKNRHRNIELGEFIIMPNHLHGIIFLQNDTLDIENKHSTQSNTKNLQHAKNNPKTGHALSLQAKPIGKNRFQNIGKKSLSAIIGGYKSAVTKHANRLNLDFAWQPRFYEHIIRDESTLHKITEYINNNPLTWEQDKFYPDNM